MRRAHILLLPVIALGLSGCLLKKTPVAAAAPPPPKPAAAPTPAPPPEPLSVPQTSVQLPPPQPPLTQEAIDTTQPPEETPVVVLPARPSGRPSGSRQGTGAPRPAPEQPAPPAAAPPATAEPDRPPLTEQLLPTEVKRLQDEATARKNEARQLVNQARRGHLNRQQTGMVERINSFITQAEQAENRGDMRQASELAERALVLAKELRP
jgi:hypothetical protein